MAKLFVGGLAYSVTNQQVEELFSKFGAVTSASVVMDKYSGQSKGFAFVEMPNDSESNEAIKQLDGYGLEGRRIGVSVARPREDSRSDNRRSDFKKSNYKRDDYRR